MARPNGRVVTAAALAVIVVLLRGALPAQVTPALPDRLSNQEFWALSQDSSEPGGYFRSADITNLTSNELYSQHVLPDLIGRVPEGRVYLGVGPEQNFTYMAAIRPRLAIIFDIRRGNLDLHLMYKALFELATDRADFVSLLFAKPRPAGLGAKSTAPEIFTAFTSSDTSRALYDKTLAAIRSHLTKTRQLPLPQRDLDGIEAVYSAFYVNGYYVRASPSYWDLMVATDVSGTLRSYLATEERFTMLKNLQARNLVVPVVGDFAGPKAIRAVARYLRDRSAIVGAFYLSNVEQYLPDWRVFCGNVAALPLDGTSTFIRSQNGGGGRGGGFVNSLGLMAAEVQNCR
jgi:hypothetical protein